MAHTTLKLVDLIDVEYLQKLQDTFAATSKATMVIMDSEGKPITEPSNRDGLCSLFSETDQGMDTCLANTRNLAVYAGKTGRPEAGVCPHMGLTTAVVPIFVGRQYLGCWSFGQMRITDPPDEDIVAASKKFNVSAHKVRDALHGLPRLSMAESERLFAFAETLTNIIGEMGHKNLELTARGRELRGIAEQMAARDAILTRFSQSSVDAMYISDFYTGEILMVNKALCDQTGLLMHEALGRKCWTVSGGIGADTFCPDCPRSRLLNEDNSPGERSVREYFNDRLGLWLRCTHQTIPWTGGRIAHMVTQQDVTKEQKMLERLENLAYSDTRTGLPNLNKLLQNVAETLQAGVRTERSLICLYLSSLRLFNDVYGADADSAIISTVVQWLQTLDFGDHTLYRLSNDEFCLSFRRADEQRSREIAGAIRDRFETPWIINLGGNEFSFVGGVSIAIISPLPLISSVQDVQSLINRTLDKARKTDGIFLYDRETDRKNREQTLLHLHLEDSVKQGMQGFSVHYQPVVSIASGKWQGLDAVDGFFLSVNMSSRQMMDEGFADTVGAILTKHGYPGEKLDLEITESAEITFSNFAMSVIERLRGHGVKLALDDFGTGYSSFNYLKHLPVDFLKTEREFIVGIEDDTYMQYFFYIMCEMAHANGMKLIAEGIETAEQLKTAKNNGADFIQGYFFSKPLSAEELADKRYHFFSRDVSFIPLTSETIDIRQWLSGKSAYELTPNLFKLLNECMRVMLEEDDLAASFAAVLKLAGTHFGVSRAFVFLEEPDGLYSNPHEWCADGVPPQKHLLQRIDVRTVTPSVIAAFRDEGMIIASDISKLPVDLYEELRPQDVNAVALMPLWHGETMLGFVGFDSTAMFEWSSDAIVMLWNLGMILVTILNREQLKKGIQERQTLLDALFLTPSLNAYVTDPETYDLLWVNGSAPDRFDLPENPVGRKCYEVIEGLTEPCPHCVVNRLRETPGIGQIEGTHYSPHLERTFLVYDSLIRWMGGKTAHVCHSLDLDACRPKTG